MSENRPEDRSDIDAAELFETARGAYLDGEDADTIVAETELWELVAAHRSLRSMARRIEDEFEFRMRTDQKIAAADDEVRDYVARWAETDQQA